MAAPAQHLPSLTSLEYHLKEPASGQVTIPPPPPAVLLLLRQPAPWPRALATLIFLSPLPA